VAFGESAPSPERVNDGSCGHKRDFALLHPLGRTITLSEVPDAEIEKWSAYHFDTIWLMGVWQTGEQSRTLALNNASHPGEWTDILPDWKPDDVVASPYSMRLRIQLQVTASQTPWAVPLRLPN
jgi:hypothetical protein